MFVTQATSTCKVRQLIPVSKSLRLPTYPKAPRGRRLFSTSIRPKALSFEEIAPRQPHTTSSSILSHVLCNILSRVRLSSCHFIYSFCLVIVREWKACTLRRETWSTVLAPDFLLGYPPLSILKFWIRCSTSSHTSPTTD